MSPGITLPPRYRFAILLFSLLIIASPASAQAITRVENPTEALPCGLPVYGFSNQNATRTEWTLTSDCDLASADYTASYMHFTSDSATGPFEFTINGAGYTVTGPPNTSLLFIEHEAILNLNNITLASSGPSCVGGQCAPVIVVASAATLNANGLTIRDVEQGAAINFWGGIGNLRNFRVINHHSDETGWNGIINISGINPQNEEVAGGGVVTITNSEFRDNTGAARLFLIAFKGMLTLEGTLITEDNTYVDADTNETLEMALHAKSADASFVDNSSPPSPPRTRSSRRSRGSSPKPTPTPKPRVCTGLALLSQGYILSANHGLCSGVQFQVVDAAGVGIQSVIDMGLIDAIDVWGYVEPGVQVCFPQRGNLVFLDATTIPRTVLPLQADAVAGVTCATIHREGTIVLVQADEAEQTQTITEQTPTISLSNCEVTIQYALNFRAAPDLGGEVLDVIPMDYTLTALEYIDGWFKVDLFGAQGWVSANYVSAEGDCA